MTVNGIEIWQQCGKYFIGFQHCFNYFEWMQILHEEICTSNHKATGWMMLLEHYKNTKTVSTKIKIDDIY